MILSSKAYPAAAAVLILAVLLVWIGSRKEDPGQLSENMKFSTFNENSENGLSKNGERASASSLRVRDREKTSQAPGNSEREKTQNGSSMEEELAEAAAVVRKKGGKEAIEEVWDQTTYETRRPAMREGGRQLSRIATVWARQDREAAWQWIEDHGRDGSNFDSGRSPAFLEAVIGGYVDAVVETDPEEAAEASKALPGGENDLTGERERAVDRRSTEQFDPDAERRSVAHLPLRSYRLPGQGEEAPGPDDE